MEYDASIAYRIPVPTNVVAAEAAAEQGRFLGLKCPICSRTYTGGRGFCPIDSIELTSEHEVDLPHTGVLTNYTIITPTQYPGQTATEPFARVHIWLDGTDVVLGYQSLLEVPVEDVHIGIRVKAVWDVAASKDNPRSEGGLVGVTPTGEPDNTDPTPSQPTGLGQPGTGLAPGQSGLSHLGVQPGPDALVRPGDEGGRRRVER